jgi:hypothetical protein
MSRQTAISLPDQGAGHLALGMRIPETLAWIERTLR